MNDVYLTYFNSEIGLIKITGSNDGILSLDFSDEKVPVKSSSKRNLPDCMKECLSQLSEYFAGDRKKFDLRLMLNGTEFQKKVWKELTKIPYGKTFSYKESAEKSGNVKAVRAVGNANNKNKIAVIIPCHRVIGSNKKLVGYAGGIWRKEWLINHENVESVK